METSYQTNIKKKKRVSCGKSKLHFNIKKATLLVVDIFLMGY